MSPPGSAVHLDEAHGDSTAGTWLLNPADVVRARLISTGTNDAGCCGSDGMDGPNRQCVCGAIVATESSDCWTAAVVSFAPGAVVARAVTD